MRLAILCYFRAGSRTRPITPMTPAATTSRRRHSHWRRRLLRRFLFVVLLLAAGYVARTPLLTGAARLLVVDTAAAADYIVPLGGAASTRPFEAAALYREGLAPRVLLMEYRTDDAIRLGVVPSETELYRRVLELEGVPGEAIEVVPGIARTTWDEALAVRRALPADEPVRIIVVTSPEHTRRALWAFREALADTAADVRVAPAPQLRYDETNWWRRDEGLLAYLHEYLKLPFYWVRYTFAS